MSTDNSDEKRLWIVVRAVCILALAAFIVYGYFIAGGTCGIDADFLYCKFHPATALSIIGSILVISSILLFGGITKLIFGEVLIPAGSSWPNIVAFIAGALGVLLIMAT